MRLLQHDISTTSDIWRQFARIETSLEETDDVEFWKSALGQVIADARHLIAGGSRNNEIVARIGRCSHWLRPHQFVWTAGGGFAVPVGYGGSGCSLRGLPEFDWSLRWQWHRGMEQWIAVDEMDSKRALTLRIAAPSRTSIHRRAAIHAIWTPGSPVDPKSKSVQFYGFQKQHGVWRLTAHRGDASLYEAALPG